MHVINSIINLNLKVLRGHAVVRVLFLFFSFTIISLPLLSQNDSIESFRRSITTITRKYPVKSDSSFLILKQWLNTPEINNNPIKKAFVVMFIGNEYWVKKNDVHEAFKYFNQALDLANKTGDCSTQIWALTFINQYYFGLNNMTLFIENYEKAAALYEQCPESNRGVYVYTQLGYNYTNMEKAALAEKYLLKADSVINAKPQTDIREKQFAYSALMDFYKTIGHDNRKTLFYAQKAKTLHLQQKDKIIDVDLSIYFFIMDIFKNIGEVDSALYYAHYLQRLPIQNKNSSNVDFIFAANKRLSELYELKGDLKNANYYKQKYIDYADSVLTKTRRGVAEQTIQNLENQLTVEKQKQDLANGRVILYATLGVMAMIFFILGVLYLFYKKQQKFNSTLQAQKVELTELNSIRVKMFSILSHDLRSPIGALQNMIDLYKKGAFTKDDFKTYTSELGLSLSAILKTIDNILNWSYTQLDGKKPFVEPLDIQNIIKEQIELQAAMARQKDVQLNNNVPNGFMIHADFNQMSLIVRNLLDNAIKYTIEGGKIDVNAFLTEGGKILEFKDTGKGMNAEKLNTLFKKDSKNNSFSIKNAGLGLQMVGDLIKVNDSTITVMSKEGAGSTFSLLFKN